MIISVKRNNDGRFRLTFARDDGRRNCVYLTEDEVLALSDSVSRAADGIVEERCREIVRSIGEITERKTKGRARYGFYIRRLESILGMNKKQINE